MKPHLHCEPDQACPSDEHMVKALAWACGALDFVILDKISEIPQNSGGLCTLSIEEVLKSDNIGCYGVEWRARSSNDCKRVERWRAQSKVPLESRPRRILIRHHYFRPPLILFPVSSTLFPPKCSSDFNFHRFFNFTCCSPR